MIDIIVGWLVSTVFKCQFFTRHDGMNAEAAKLVVDKSRKIKILPEKLLTELQILQKVYREFIFNWSCSIELDTT